MTDLASTIAKAILDEIEAAALAGTRSITLQGLTDVVQRSLPKPQLSEVGFVAQEIPAVLVTSDKRTMESRAESLLPTGLLKLVGVEGRVEVAWDEAKLAGFPVGGVLEMSFCVYGVYGYPQVGHWEILSHSMQDNIVRIMRTA